MQFEGNFLFFFVKQKCPLNLPLSWRTFYFNYRLCHNGRKKEGGPGDAPLENLEIWVKICAIWRIFVYIFALFFNKNATLTQSLCGENLINLCLRLCGWREGES